MVDHRTAMKRLSSAILFASCLYVAASGLAVSDILTAKGMTLSVELNQPAVVGAVEFDTAKEAIVYSIEMDVQRLFPWARLVSDTLMVFIATMAWGAIGALIRVLIANPRERSLLLAVAIGGGLALPITLLVYYVPVEVVSERAGLLYAALLACFVAGCFEEEALKVLKSKSPASS